MPSFNANALLADLSKDVHQLLIEFQQLISISKDVLLLQPSEGKWSVAQVLEHLNAYNRFYLPEIEKGIAGGRHDAAAIFKTGLFGNYFTNMMKPKENKVVNKMNAPKNYAFGPELDIDKVAVEFEEGAQRLLQLLDKAKHTNLDKVKLPISISRFIRLKLGDVFMFLIAHQQRHFVQIAYTLKAVQA